MIPNNLTPLDRHRQLNMESSLSAQGLWFFFHQEQCFTCCLNANHIVESINLLSGKVVELDLMMHKNKTK